MSTKKNFLSRFKSVSNLLGTAANVEITGNEGDETIKISADDLRDKITADTDALIAEAGEGAGDTAAAAKTAADTERKRWADVTGGENFAAHSDYALGYLGNSDMSAEQINAALDKVAASAPAPSDTPKGNQGKTGQDALGRLAAGANNPDTGISDPVKGDESAEDKRMADSRNYRKELNDKRNKKSEKK